VMIKNPNAIDVHVGSRIRLRRTMLGMSQERLAEGLGITFQQVQKYEKGTNRVGASRLQNIASLLSAPISFFFEGSPGPVVEGDDAASEAISQIMNSKECFTLARHFMAIEDKKVQQKVLALVKSLSLEKSEAGSEEGNLHSDRPS
jgi:transcriptional regulator with XRE-family HTH domain